jgi:hypothetical protein
MGVTQVRWRQLVWCEIATSFKELMLKETS